MTGLSLAPDGTRAVLVGASQFPRDTQNLPPLPGVVANVEDLARLLTDPEVVGIPAEHVVRLVDQAAPTTVAEALATAAQEADDLLFVYYAGHGLVGTSSLELFLATGDSTYAHAEYNSLPFAAVRRAVHDSPARKKILVLDCCFSGRALEIMGSEPGLVQANLDLRGTFALASSPANAPSVAPEGARYTAFTGELVRALGEGIDNGRDVLTLEDIYDDVRQALRRANLPEPQRVNFQEASSFVFARNRHQSARTVEALEREVRELRALVEERDREVARLRHEATMPAGPEVVLHRPRVARVAGSALAIVAPVALQKLVIIRSGDTSVQGALAGLVLLLLVAGLTVLARRAADPRQATPGLATLLFPSSMPPTLVLRLAFWSAVPVLLLTLWTFRYGRLS